MSIPRRHFSWWTASAGIAALRRRSSTVGAAALLAGSQDSGTNNRQSTGHDAVSVTRFKLTPIWQLVTFPAVPVYCRATPTDAVPHLSQPVSSTAHAAGAIASSIRCASRRRTSMASQGLFVTAFHHPARPFPRTLNTD
jgi:hypothetical protein